MTNAYDQGYEDSRTHKPSMRITKTIPDNWTRSDVMDYSAGYEDGSEAPEECEKCGMDLLPLENYPAGWPKRDRWLCAVCANTHSEPDIKDVPALVHLLYAKLLDLEKKLDMLIERN